MAARIVSGALLVAIWFAFSASTTIGEVIAAIVVAGIAAVAHVVVRRAAGARAGETRLRWLGQALRSWPPSILRDTATVLRALVRARPPSGSLQQVPFEPTSAAELTWAIIGTSIAPNAYVVGWDARARVLLVHTLEVGAGKPDIVWRPR